ncbi:MAG: phosphopantothenoylcysteine decarboxylase [Victivallaceae bacterium]|nr:phosphopantothenoylcysteine decarboxylase [Victivallaceae bacterium]
MKVLITAGPTREAIDAVRFISNRSTGKMGYALAAAAVKRGFEVVLVSGPVSLSEVAGARIVQVESAAEMAAAVRNNLDNCDVVIMAAAVADYRPKTRFAGKLKKKPGGLTLELERTEDILAMLGASGRPGLRLVGFAAETDDVERNAKEKLTRKHLDFIAANDVSRPECGFAADTNCVTVYGADGGKYEIPFGSKAEVADEMWKIITGDVK